MPGKALKEMQFLKNNKLNYTLLLILRNFFVSYIQPSSSKQLSVNHPILKPHAVLK